MSMRPVLVISHDVVGHRLAGPGLRAWHLAHELARSLDVILAVPQQAGQVGQTRSPEAREGCLLWPYVPGDWQSLAPAVHRARAILAAGDSVATFPALERLGVPLVVDGYDPHTLETLALWAGEPADVQAARHAERLDVVRRQCRAADFLVCASERQRDWWLGVLEEQGRVNPLTFGDDPSLRRLIDVVPFGLPAEPPRVGQPTIRGVWPGVEPDDELVLWGGGLWEWLDPLTALRAVGRLAGQGRPVRLAFPGTRHPNPAMPDMPLRARTLALADELGLTGRHVFFGDWLPYEDWPAALLEADVGLSLHPDTVETRLSYRTRVLDYAWAGLPMVVTRGDAAADLVARYGLGEVVDYGDEMGAARALAGLLDQGRQALRAGYRCRFETARLDLTWERAAGPLLAFCREPRLAADRQPQRLSPRARSQPMSIERVKCPAVSVIVLAWNGASYIESCLEALLAQDYPALELIVVDNGSEDGTPELVAGRFADERVRLLRQPRNLGFAAGNNAGLRAAGGELLVLLNQDTRVHPGWLSALVDAFEDPTVGIAGCKLLYPDGTVQHAGGFIYGPRGESDHHGRRAPDGGGPDEPLEVEFVTAAALAVRRQVIDQVGLLDEGFSPAYYEDVDWCYRARAAGWRVVYVPTAAVTHFESTTTGAESHERKFALHQGRLRFLLKHRPLDWLLGEFGPAESSWVAALDRSEEVMAARRAYLGAMLALPSILAWRGAESEAAALLGLLSDLRAAAIASLVALTGPGSSASLPRPSDLPPPPPAEGSGPTDEGSPLRARLLDEMEAAHAIHERPFTSGVPLLGRLIVAARTLWNNVATRWYVRPMIQQQSVLNAQMIGYLRVLQDEIDHLAHHGELIGWLSSRSERLEARSDEQAELLQGQLRLVQGQVRDVAENVRELTFLAERLARLEEAARDRPTDADAGS